MVWHVGHGTKLPIFLLDIAISCRQWPHRNRTGICHPKRPWNTLRFVYSTNPTDDNTAWDKMGLDI